MSKQIKPKTKSKSKYDVKVETEFTTYILSSILQNISYYELTQDYGKIKFSLIQLMEFHNLFEEIVDKD